MQRRRFGHKNWSERRSEPVGWRNKGDVLAKQPFDLTRVLVEYEPETDFGHSARRNNRLASRALITADNTITVSAGTQR